MALITTFATTPLTSLLYPPWYQKKIQAWKRGEIDWDTGEVLRKRNNGDDSDLPREGRKGQGEISSLLIYLRLDNMPNTLAFVSLFGGKPNELKAKIHPHHEEHGASNSESPEKKKTIVDSTMSAIEN
jgi:hypothetical protein